MNIEEIMLATQLRSSQTSIETERAVRTFEKGLPFRGLLPNVQGSKDVLEDSKLGWKVHTLPVVVQGKTSQRLASGYQALIRGDTGDLLSITSDKFRPHQNSEILHDMQSLAEAGEAEIVYAGPLDGGRKIVAIAKMEGEFDLGGSFPDRNALFAIISGGHEVGTPFKLKGMAFRLVCFNGAFFAEHSQYTYSVTHRRSLASEQVGVRKTFEGIREQFSKFGETANRLKQTSMDYDQSRLLVAELLRPGIAKEIEQKLALRPDADAVWAEVGDTLRGKNVLEAILAESSTPMNNRLLDAIAHQTGHAGANLWTGYNGVSFYVDHERGRSPETGVDASLFGQGAKLKERALQVAESFSNRS